MVWNRRGWKRRKGVRFVVLLFLCVYTDQVFGQSGETTIYPLEITSPDIVYSNPYFAPGGQIQNMYWNGQMSHNLNAWFNLNMQSQSMPGNFMRKLITGGQISEEDKTKSFGKLKPQNRIGLHLSSGLSYLQKPSDEKYKSLSFLYKYKFNHETGIAYTDDFFELLFDGNSRFEGQTADFSELSATSMQYHQLQFGVIGPVKASKPELYYGLLASVNVGNNYLKFNTDNATLFTAPLGEYLDLDWNMSAYLSDTSTKGLLSADGIGFSVDAMLGYQIDQWSFSISITDAGFMHWNRNTVHLQADTALRFEGIELNNFIGKGSAIADYATVDSMMVLTGVDPTGGAMNSSLPLGASFIVSKYMADHKAYLTFGAMMRWYVAYRPLLYARYQKNLIKAKMGFALDLSYGGYGGVNLGLMVRKTFADRFALLIGTNSLLPWIVGSRPGVSGYALLSWSF